MQQKEVFTAQRKRCDIGSVFTKALPDQPHDCLTIAGGKFIINPNPDVFIKHYLDLFFEGAITDVYRYGNGGNMESGLTVDVDVEIPCDAKFVPLDLNEDMKLAWSLATNIQKRLKELLKIASHDVLGKSGKSVKEHAEKHAEKELLSDQYSGEETEEVEEVERKVAERSEAGAELIPIPDELLQFIILARTVPDEQRVKISGKQAYVRYGFHIYFNKFKTSVDIKRYLSDELRLDGFEDLYKQIQTRYPMTLVTQYFDKSPFKGTTSIPLSFQGQLKRYDYVVTQTQNPDQFERIRITPQYPREGTPEMQKNGFPYLNLLNPFGGVKAFVDPTVQLQQRPTNITNWIKNNYCKNYEQSVYKVSEYLLKECQNKTLYTVLIKFNHPKDFRIREKLVCALYEYFKHSLLQTELAYFMAMVYDAIPIIDAEQFTKFQAMDPDEIFNCWFDKSVRDRDPIKVQRYVEDTIQKYTPKGDAEFIIKDIIQLYNNNGTQFALENGTEFEPQTEQFGVFDGFVQFMKFRFNGIFANMELESLSEKEFKAQFNQYVFNKLREKLIVRRPPGKKPIPELYIFEDEDMSHDTGHYHLVEETAFGGMIKQYYNHFIEDYTSQLLTFPFEERIQKVNDPAKFVLMVSGIDYMIQVADYKACLNSMVADNHKRMQCDPDSESNIMGVYNGVLQFCPENGDEKPRFRLLRGNEAREHFVCRHAIFQIDPMMCDEDGYLRNIQDYVDDPANQLLPVVMAYKHLMQSYQDIFMDDMPIFEWKIYQAIYRALIKNCPAQQIYTCLGGGSDAKTFTSQPFVNVLGQGEAKTCIDRRTGNRRTPTHKGYGSAAKPTILQNTEKGSSGHNQGGTSELLGSCYAVCAELPENLPWAISSIKEINSGTAVQSRAIWGDHVDTFVNCTQIEVNANKFPQFDGTMDKATQRRLLFHTMVKKFLTKAEYDAIDDPDKEQKYGIKDPTLFEKAMYDFDYMDAIGLIMLNVMQTRYQDPVTRNVNEIPQRLIQESHNFFENQLTYYRTFKQQLIVTNNDTDVILHQDLMQTLQQFLEQKYPRDYRTQNKQKADYENILFDDFLNQLFTMDGDLYFSRVQINEITQLKVSPTQLLVYKGVRYQKKKEYKRQIDRWNDVVTRTQEAMYSESSQEEEEF